MAFVALNTTLVTPTVNVAGGGFSVGFSDVAAAVLGGGDGTTITVKPLTAIAFISR